MRFIFLFFLLTFSSFACYTVLSYDLNNTVVYLNFSECLYIIDLNTTIYPPQIPLLNNTVNLTAFQTISDNLTNITYICNYNKVDAHLQLDFNTTYTNQNNNITILPPPFPKINQDLNLTPTNNLTFSEYNLTINTIYPQKNLNKNLSYNEEYNVSELNITIRAPPFPNINQDVFVEKCGFSKTFDIFNLTVLTHPCKNEIINLDRGIIYRIDFFNLSLITQKKINATLNISNNQFYENKDEDLLIRCTVSNEEFINFCKSTNITPYIPIWSIINTSNFTCKNYLYTCLDDITQYCNLEEKTTPELGFINCFNRNINEMITIKKQSEQEVAKCFEEKNILIATNNNMKAGIQNTQDILLMVLISVVVLITLLLGTYMFIQNLKQKEGIL